MQGEPLQFHLESKETRHKEIATCGSSKVVALVGRLAASHDGRARGVEKVFFSVFQFAAHFHQEPRKQEGMLQERHSTALLQLQEECVTEKDCDDWHLVFHNNGQCGANTQCACLHVDSPEERYSSPEKAQKNTESDSVAVQTFSYGRRALVWHRPQQSLKTKKLRSETKAQTVHFLTAEIKRSEYRNTLQSVSPKKQHARAKSLLS